MSEDNERFMPGNSAASGKETENRSHDRDDSIGSAADGQLPDDTMPFFRNRTEKSLSRDSKPFGETAFSSESDTAMPNEMPPHRPDGDQTKKMRKKLVTTRLWLWIGMPVAVIAALVIGMAIGPHINIRHTFMSPEERKLDSVKQIVAARLGPVIYTVQQEYVDILPIDTLLEKALNGMMNSLDPHSAYISARDLGKVNEELAGEFSGVGVSFILHDDTIAVVEAIPGGPAANAGIDRGDRILSANGKPLTGDSITSETVFSTLRGKSGSSVTLKVKRAADGRTVSYSVRRGAVPVNSVDAAYILDDGRTGYVKISSFTSNTYEEAYRELNRLSREGAEDFIIDLRANPGGFMDQAILLANEFLPAGSGIVYTKARKAENQMNVKADGLGNYQKSNVAVLIDENSASASEIFAGAIQDNDRGAVVGRRSFGKGLVQNQFEDIGGGALRLTVARYFTPSGRSIQKDYVLGDNDSYANDILDRYNHGELFNADSIKFDKTKLFKTVGGRNVYGGGGIMPDYFVPEDTSSYTPYYINAMSQGLISDYAFAIADRYRPLTKNVRTEEQLFRILPDDDRLLNGFTEYAEERGLPAAWYYIGMSRDMIINKLKAFISRDLLDDNLFYKWFNRDDAALRKAQDALRQKTLPAEPKVK